MPARVRDCSLCAIVQITPDNNKGPLFVKGLLMGHWFLRKQRFCSYLNEQPCNLAFLELGPMSIEQHHIIFHLHFAAAHCPESPFSSPRRSKYRYCIWRRFCPCIRHRKNSRSRIRLFVSTEQRCRSLVLITTLLTFILRTSCIARVHENVSIL